MMPSKALLPEIASVIPGPLPLLAAFTCDIEPDFGMRTGTTELLEEERYMHAVLDAARENAFPITAFVVTELLSRNLPGIRLLRETGVELHPHSHTHDRKRYAKASGEEIRKSQDAFHRELGRRATGYRAPQGVLYPGDIEVLTESGFSFDASVFPGCRFGVFDNRAFPREPWRWKGGLLELPFATTGKRAMLTMSYLRLYGEHVWERRLHASDLPRILILDAHLHDFFTPASVRRLPLPFRLAYGRNCDRGLAFLAWITETLKCAGYRFTTMQAIADALMGR